MVSATLRYGRECKQKKENLHQQLAQRYVIYYCEKMFSFMCENKKEKEKEVESWLRFSKEYLQN